ncbi:unnamed protein product [Hanseniaspora opuntiae]
MYNNRYNNGGYNNHNNYNSSNAHPNNVGVKFTGGGIHPNMNGKDFQNFIYKKTKINLYNYQVPKHHQQTNGGYYTYTAEVANRGLAQNLCTFSSMLKYNNAHPSIKIEIADGNNNPASRLNQVTANTSSGTGKVLNEYVLQRYNPAGKMLNLANFAQDQLLAATGLLSNTHKLTLGLLKIVDLLQKNDGIVVETLDLSGNGFKDLHDIKELPMIIPNLVNLSLSNNMIGKSNIFTLNWKNKFKKLRELIVTNNPLCNTAGFQNDILVAFPKLIVLNSQLIRDEAKVNTLFTVVPPNPAQPTEQGKLQQFVFETPDIGSYTTQFVANFFNLWDNQANRQQLTSLYQQESQFSLSVDSSIPPSAVDDAEQNPNFNIYNNLNRNLNKLTMTSSQTTKNNRTSRVFMGNMAIGQVFNQLPSTKHFLVEDPKAYSIQNIKYSTINGMMVTIHGYYEELADPIDKSNMPKQSNNVRRGGRYNSYNQGTNIKYGKKCFDRTLCLIPGENGTPIIASDILNIRAYVKAAWNYESPALNKPLSQGSTASNPAYPNGAQATPSTNMIATTPEEKQQLCLKVQQYTKLNQEWAIMLCQQSNWNYDLAIRGFTSSQANIPPNAYQ